MVLISIFIFAPGAGAEVYKWVDREGNAHYSDAPPKQYESKELQMEQAPSEEEVRGSQQRAEQMLKKSKELEESRKIEKQLKSFKAEATDEPERKQSLTLEELDRRCEEAIEEKIVPLREAAITECIADKNSRMKNPREDCERFYQDYGAGGPATGGRWRPRMFHNLPECVEAGKARRESGRR